MHIKGMLNHMISKPEGWRASLSMAEDTVLTITAPAKENTYAETEGTVAISMTSVTGEFKMVTVSVKAVDKAAYELRILTAALRGVRHGPR